MENSQSQTNIVGPKSGLAGLKDNWQQDAMSGFLVSLIALPLSLGIAGASGFPPIMGVLTAIVGGLVVAFFAGSALTIKGPAAGLIVIIAGAVEALGYEQTLLVVVIAGVIQIVFGLLKVASLANFFPLSAVHGMLAAIGLIIMSKQLHFVLGVDPDVLKGKDTLELLEMLPHSLMNMTPAIAIIGGISLLILFGMPLIKNKIVKAIPAPLVVLIVSIILGIVLNLTDPVLSSYKPLVAPGSMSFSLQADFQHFNNSTSGIFIQYIILFTLIGSLESVLTVKAVDLLDPWKRKALLNKDLIAVGIGNMVSGLLGGLPMISEVARSSANVNNGGRTQWANFFHSISLLLFVVLLVPVIKMVPIAALAAMLIYVGYRLASPKTFMHAYKVGLEQLVVFIATIVTTLATDLLIGIGVGILLEFIIDFFTGQKLSTLFSAPIHITEEKKVFTVKIEGACTFSNWISFNAKFNRIPLGSRVVIDATNARFLDHTFMENIHHLQDEWSADGGCIDLIGIDDMKRMSNDCTSACMRKFS